MANKPTGGLIKGKKREKMVKMTCDWKRGGVLAKDNRRTYQGGGEEKIKNIKGNTHKKYT